MLFVSNLVISKFQGFPYWECGEEGGVPPLAENLLIPPPHQEKSP